ncbi:hypothetical protein AMS68_003358 [Peltaster fructicola]|uniref:Exonuclease domain-containing protein n=1 Tax=Peltaster fructicola TaxID=286661 RepID=A0A6H0XT49_9PEZI|nr:hypothetical protein AMS68_003358 [Peltaster fructicola]
MATAPATGSCKVVLAATIAKSLLVEINDGLKQTTRKPILHGFLANKDPAARMYADWTAKTCRENGFDFQLREVDREDLEDELRTANHDKAVDGVIVYYPVFDSARDRTLQWTVSLNKDVEGLSPQLISNMYQNVRFLDPPHNTQKSILPCTPLAIVKILEHLHIYNTILDYGQRLFGRRITVINRSEVVGRPLAALLANDGAEVYSADITGIQRFSRGTGLRKQKHDVQDMDGWKLEDCLAVSDVVISGVPGDNFKVPTALVREGAVCINFSKFQSRHQGKSFDLCACHWQDNITLQVQRAMSQHDKDHPTMTPSKKRTHDELVEVDTAAEQPATERPDVKRARIGSDENDGDNPTASDQDGWQVVKRKKGDHKRANDRRAHVYPSITHSHHSRLQTVVRLADMQNLVLYILTDGPNPQWCSVKHRSEIRKVVVLMVPGLESGMFGGDILLPTNDHSDDTSNRPDNKTTEADEAETAENQRKGYSSPDDFYPTALSERRLPAPLQPLAKIFEHLWPLKTPGDDRYAKLHSPLNALMSVPIAKPTKKSGKGASAPIEKDKRQDNRVSITELLASTQDLMLQDFVLHPACFDGDEAAAQSYQETRDANKTSVSHGWRDTPNISTLADGEVPDNKIEKGASTAGRHILAIDCEMCITSRPGEQPVVSSLTRMTVIDWDGEIVLDELVKPADPITNYVTAYSGITAKMLENVTTTLQEAQQMLLDKITPQTILVGHSLESDLAALRIAHPFIADTALLYPHPRGPPLKSSLKYLAQKYLSRNIQSGHGSTGHDSIEDARASLDLVKQKCQKGKLWGTSDSSSESIFARLSRSSRSKRFKIHPDAEDEPLLGAVVDWGDPSRGFGGQAKVAIGCKSDSDVVNGVKDATSGGASNCPADGVDFVWARLRELEAYRGWWSSSKTKDVDALRLATLDTDDELKLGDVVLKTVSRIQEIWDALPPCTAFIVYSGSGDPRKHAQLQEQKQKHKEEYAVKKWDEISVTWTDAEESRLRRACESARKGIGFVAVK